MRLPALLLALAPLMPAVSARPIEQAWDLQGSLDAFSGSPSLFSKRAVSNALPSPIRGPVFTAGPGANFPDPSLLRIGNVWYAFATRTIGAGVNVPLATSPDYMTWTMQTTAGGATYDAMPSLPPWVATGVTDTKVWAPDVSVLDDGSFIMYFSALTQADSTKHCIGAARSRTILGPYMPDPAPLFCPLAAGGAIDAAGFTDTTNGATQRYVVYKVDGNSIGHGGACGNTVAPLVPTPILLQQVGPDGTTLIGTPVTLLNHNGTADDGIVEAPSLARARNGVYYLTFSSGCFATSHYTVSYATSRSLTRPFARASQPVLKAGMYGLTAPGSADVWTDASHIVFHDGPVGARKLYTMVI